MKRIACLLLALAMVLTCAGCVTQPPVASDSATTIPTTAQTTPTTQTTVPETTAPPVDYANSTVILYSANVRGDVQVYSAMAAARESYEALGATVYLVDAGNYLQGSAYANVDMGLTIYRLMEAAGYDVAGMGVYDLVHGEAEVGYAAHGDLVKFYTQAQLYRGTGQLHYQRNGYWEKEPVMAVREAIPAAGFQVICSNLYGEITNGYYSFETSVVLGESLKIGFVSAMPGNVLDYVRQEFLAGYQFTHVAAPQCDVLVALGNTAGDIVIDAPADGDLRVGACVIDNSTGYVTFETVDLSARNAQMDALIAALQSPEIIGTCGSVYNGSQPANYNGQTNLGTLAADALKWYAETYMEGLEYPVIGIQSGSNCRNFLFSGDITMTDLYNAYHGSVDGIGVIYLTGAQILEALEAATQRENCPGWAQVSGISYTVDMEKPYDWGAAYGPYYEAASVNRVSILTEGFDPEATYAVVADMLLLRGSDTYYVFKDCEVVARGENDLDISRIVALYIQQALNGQLD